MAVTFHGPRRQERDSAPSWGSHRPAASRRVVGCACVRWRPRFRLGEGEGRYKDSAPFPVSFVLVTRSQVSAAAVDAPRSFLTSAEASCFRFQNVLHLEMRRHSRKHRYVPRLQIERRSQRRECVGSGVDVRYPGPSAYVACRCNWA